MRIFFAVDAHGATKIWKKWIRVPEIYEVDVLMLCGDLTGKVLVPIVKQKDNTYEVSYIGKKLKLSSKREVDAVREKLAEIGQYAIVCEESMVESFKVSPQLVEKIIEQKIQERMEEWMEFLVTHVNINKIKVIIMPGNDDVYSIDPIIKSYSEKGIIWCLDNVVKIDSVEIIGLAHTNPTPWNTPREATERELARMIENLANKLKTPEKAIFNFHAPPYGTQLDLAPELNKNKKPVIVGGQIRYIHVGSKAVREAIEKYQPLLGLHGHIHESPGVVKIGKTVCINPGSEYSEGILHGYIIEVENGELQNYWKVEG